MTMAKAVIFPQWRLPLNVGTPSHSRCFNPQVTLGIQGASSINGVLQASIHNPFEHCPYVCVHHRTVRENVKVWPKYLIIVIINDMWYTCAKHSSKNMSNYGESESD